MDRLAEDEELAVRHGSCGTQRRALGSDPTSERVVCAECLAVYRLHAERIREAWAVWDTLCALALLGHASEL